MLKSELLDKRYQHPDCWGYILGFLEHGDKRSVKDQFQDRYVGGWRHFGGFKLDPTNMTLKYPDDPPMKPIARAEFRDEVIYLYPSAWVLVMHHGVWEVSRMD